MTTTNVRMPYLEHILTEPAGHTRHINVDIREFFVEQNRKQDNLIAGDQDIGGSL